MKPLVAAALILAFGPACPGAPKWALKYFYDQDKSSFTVNDVSFPSPSTGIAVGVLEGAGGGPASLVTRDGGAHWELERLKEPPLSLAFLNDSLGWMVTGKGIWRTEEAGRNWTKIASLKDVQRVRFLTPERGFAAGMHKSVWATGDGGKTWAKIPAAEPKSKAIDITYTWIEFANPKTGMILGWNGAPPPANNRLPDWIDPDAALQRREWLSFSITLQTVDSGKTWKGYAASLSGYVSRLRMLPDGRSLGLIETFASIEEYPSEVYQINWITGGKSERVFRDKQVAVTDILLLPSGRAFLAGIRHPGEFKRGPIPGRLAVYSSRDLRIWTPMEVDYRASGRRAVFAAAGENDVWVATDAGMLLKLSGTP
jgi:hypothetical protein